jgi:hypothetical protein
MVDFGISHSLPVISYAGSAECCVSARERGAYADRYEQETKLMSANRKPWLGFSTAVLIAYAQFCATPVYLQGLVSLFKITSMVVRHPQSESIGEN